MRCVCALGLVAVALAACAYDRPTLVDGDGGLSDGATTDTAGDGGATCTTDAQCASLVCHEQACVPSSAVRYVATTGADGAPCSQAEPCATIARALARHGTPAFVSIAGGSYTASVPINPLMQTEDPFDVWLVGSPTAARPIVLATDDGSNRDGVEVYRGGVYLRRLEVRGSPSNASSDAIWTDVGTRVTLDDVVVSSARHDGLECNDCTLVVDRSIFRSNVRVGLRVEGGSVTVRGSQFRDNAGGGASLSGDDCTVLSSMFIGNGEDGAAFGGVSLGCATHRFDGNTLAANRATNTSFAAMRCKAGPLGSVTRNNLLDHPATAGISCSFEHSLFSSGIPPPGTGNLVADPGFTVSGDYHILPTSPAYGVGTANGISVFETDIDGEPRTQGRIDIGADEIP